MNNGQKLAKALADAGWTAVEQQPGYTTFAFGMRSLDPTVTVVTNDAAPNFDNDFDSAVDQLDAMVRRGNAAAKVLEDLTSAGVIV